MQLIDDLVTENAELQQQLQSSTQQLMRKEAELTRAVETARREQQQVRQLQHTGSHVSVACKGTPLGFSLPHSLSLSYVGCVHSC